MARKILLADDSVTAQNMGRKILADAGYEVITVNNGSAALKRIAEQKPDLIVLDVYMPGYSGLEVCQRLKDAQETSRLPVLLTVGKLEPFKPEEAKRARADGFIVKPFEASELLSALSKLEDKIVPRSEAKPGRFARANAALDEARYDKTVAVEEDSGWKNRIAFPKKKTEAPPEENDDSTLYNPMNKDLRTVVERRPAETPQEARAEEPRVDLGALAPEGLPKDVTPEEIAALAAAAAQVKGKFAEGRIEDRIEEVKAAEVEPAESRMVEPPVAARTEPSAPLPEPRQTAPAMAPEAPVAAPSAAANSANRGSETQDSETQGSGTQGSGNLNSGNGSWLHGTNDENDEPVTMAVAAGAAESVAPASRWSAVAVTLAPEEAAISLDHEMQKAYAAFAAAESHAGAVATMPSTRHDSAQTAQPQIPQARTFEAQALAARPVADQYAPAVEASVPAGAVTSPAAPVQAEAIAPASQVPAIPVHEVERAFSAARAATDAVTEVAAEAIGAAVQELEAVTEAYAKEMKPAPTAPQPPPVENFKIVASPVANAPQTAPELPNQSQEQLNRQEIEGPKTEAAKAGIEAKIETKSETKIEAKIETKTEKRETGKNIEPRTEERKIEEAKTEDAKSEPSAPVVAASARKEEVNAVLPETARIAAEQAAAAPFSPVASAAISTETSANFLSSDVFSSELAAMAFGELAAGGIGDMAKKESEIAANTAAAWANWRRIRETDPKAPAPSADPNQKEESVASAPQDASMAVAAGAEKAFEEGRAAIGSEPDEIASIVDSVLADLRPKIVEEISRKMGKKK